jgi:hypothetical protein
MRRAGLGTVCPSCSVGLSGHLLTISLLLFLGGGCGGAEPFQANKTVDRAGDAPETAPAPANPVSLSAGHKQKSESSSSEPTLERSNGQSKATTAPRQTQSTTGDQETVAATAPTSEVFAKARQKAEKYYGPILNFEHGGGGPRPKLGPFVAGMSEEQICSFLKQKPSESYKSADLGANYSVVVLVFLPATVVGEHFPDRASKVVLSLMNDRLYAMEYRFEQRYVPGGSGRLIQDSGRSIQESYASQLRVALKDKYKPIHGRGVFVDFTRFGVGVYYSNSTYETFAGDGITVLYSEPLWDLAHGERFFNRTIETYKREITIKYFATSIVNEFASAWAAANAAFDKKYEEDHERRKKLDAEAAAERTRKQEEEKNTFRSKL